MTRFWPIPAFKVTFYDFGDSYQYDIMSYSLADFARLADILLCNVMY